MLRLAANIYDAVEKSEQELLQLSDLQDVLETAAWQRYILFVDLAVTDTTTVCRLLVVNMTNVCDIVFLRFLEPVITSPIYHVYS